VQKSYADTVRCCVQVIDAFSSGTADTVASDEAAGGESASDASAPPLVHGASVAVTAEQASGLNSLAEAAGAGIDDADSSTVPSLSALELYIDGYFLEL